MTKVQLNNVEWDWLVRLQFVPRRVACSEEDLGLTAITNLRHQQLVEEAEGYHRLTSLGARLIESPPPPMPDGGRVVMVSTPEDSRGWV